MDQDVEKPSLQTRFAIWKKNKQIQTAKKVELRKVKKKTYLGSFTASALKKSAQIEVPRDSSVRVLSRQERGLTEAPLTFRSSNDPFAEARQKLPEALPRVYNFSISQRKLAEELGVTHHFVRLSIEKHCRLGDLAAREYLQQRQHRKDFVKKAIEAGAKNDPGWELVQKITQTIISEGFTFKKTMKEIAKKYGVIPSKVTKISQKLVKQGLPEAVAYRNTFKENRAGFYRDVRKKKDLKHDADRVPERRSGSDAGNNRTDGAKSSSV